MSATCQTCPYFYPLGGGECRLNPPGAMPIPQGAGQVQIIPIRIPARPTEWCGQHPDRKDRPLVMS